jgi:hypothetical protein
VSEGERPVTILITGHFLPTLPEWSASTSFGYPYVQPSPPTGYYYIFESGGTSGTTQPTWPTTLNASVTDGSLTWFCLGYSAAQFQLLTWDLKQAQSVNGDLGGCWAPSTALTITAASGGFVNVTGPTVLSGYGKLQTASSALVYLDTGDFPLLASNHAGQYRRLRTDASLGLSDQPLSLRQDFALSGLRATACTLQFYTTGPVLGIGAWAPAAVVSVNNITLSGEQIIDGVFTSSSRVLVVGQTTQSQNGIYTSGTGAWTRTSDATTGSQFTADKPIDVLSGLAYAGSTWAYTGTSSPSVGTSAIYFAIANDQSVVVTTTPVRWQLNLRVHDGATLADAVLSYIANLGTPKARVVAVSALGALSPMTSTVAGADVNGWMTAPAANSTLPVQTWSIPIDGGASGNAVVSIETTTYLLQVIEDQTQTGYPGVLPVYTSVYVATTTAIDMANAPASIDGVLLTVGQRVLVKNQTDPTQNGIYIYPGAGNTFAYKGEAPIPTWTPNTVYAVGQNAQPGFYISGGHVLSKPNGLYYQVTAVTGTGTSGSAPPVWPTTSGATVVDNAGANQITWTCEGALPSGLYTQTIEVRTYGLLQGAVVPVLNGSTNAGTYWQYGGTTIPPTGVGALPAAIWGTIPTGLVAGSTADVPQVGSGIFAAPGNLYNDVAVDHLDIVNQRFQ